MTAMFTAQLINNPFSDPGVYLEFKHRREAMLFDLGDLHRVSPRQLLKVRYVFVSHTHMDHFIGFDHLLRICLGRDSHIALFGPPGFHGNIESKVKAYTWNLVENYVNDFQLDVTEIHPRHKIKRSYKCRNAFKSEKEDICNDFDGILVDEKLFSVSAAFLDHKTPCLAFRFEEKMRVNIMKNALDEMGLPTGAWLMPFKERIINNEPDETPVRIWWRDPSGQVKENIKPLGLLKEKIVRLTPGKKVTYVTDVVFSDENVCRIVELARDSDLLFIEAPFIHEDVEKATQKYHLTAFQAGMLARMAGVKRMVLFHFSPKYKGVVEMLIQEAMQAFADESP
ncbi:MAG: ribonuclease Z [Deltaproteobacteria bacterium]|nr:ribonuclease Z [Deltaproteobacteria bacterium]